MKLNRLGAVFFVTACLSRSVFGAENSQELINGISAQQAVTTEAQAEQDNHKTLEFTAGTDRLLEGGPFLNQTALFAEGRYRLGPAWQFGGSFGLRAQGNESALDDVAFQALLGPTYNFGKSAGIQNDFFISPKMGATVAKKEDAAGESHLDANPTFSLHVGKRFEIAESVSFGPAIGLVDQLGEAPSVVLQPVAVSIFL